VQARQLRATNVLAAASEAIGRVPLLGPTIVGIGWSAALGESLVWLAALDDLLSWSSAFRSDRTTDPAGQTLRGLRYVRNLAVHGEDVVGVTLSYPGAELGRLTLGVSRLGSTSTFTWLSRDDLPAPRQKQAADVPPAYDAHVAGRDVLSTLGTALLFVRRQIALHWPQVAV
jgi:hypothetical protein